MTEQAMTATQLRNAGLCVATLDAVRHAPQQAAGEGISTQHVHMGALSIRLTSARDVPELFLEAHLDGHGKVAAFLVAPDFTRFEVVSLKVKLLPLWVPLLI